MGAPKRNPAPVAAGSGADISRPYAGDSNPPIDRLLPCLEGVREVGPSKWIARCPAHDDKRPSLSIRELADGRVLIHDFGGCPAVEVLNSVDLTLSDLFDRPLAHHAPKAKAPFPALPILKSLALEAGIVFYAGAKMLSGETFSDDDNDRLRIAIERIDAGLRIAEGRA